MTQEAWQLVINNSKHVILGSHPLELMNELVAKHGIDLDNIESLTINLVHVNVAQLQRAYNQQRKAANDDTFIKQPL